MVSAAVRDDEPYQLDPSFEAAAITLACSSPRFYGRIGHELDSELLAKRPAKHALDAAHAINAELGHGPSSCLVVLQRLKRWVFDGKLPYEDVLAVADMFDDAEDRGLPAEDEAVAELAPLIQLRIRHEAVQSAIDSFGKHGDLSRVAILEDRAARVGQVDTSVGTVFGPASFAEMARLKGLERLRTGVPELDHVLGGGLQLGGLGVVIAPTGGGKSVFLNHVSATCVLDGLHVAYATLELPSALVLARFKAALTGIPIDAIIEHPEAAMARIGVMAPTLGRFVVGHFASCATTVPDIREWIARVEEHSRQKVDLLVVDYADKLTSTTNKASTKEVSEYTAGRVVYESLRLFAEEHGFFCWTASQSGRRKDKRGKRLEVDDVADSMHKVRVADLVITLTPKDAGDENVSELLHYVAKHRTGKSNVQVGPLLTEFDCGRIAPMLLEEEEP